MSALEIIEQIKALPKNELAQVVDFIHYLEEPENELTAEWKVEVDSRLADIKSGRVKTVSAEQAHAVLSKKLRDRRNAS
jgi:putative addiction module component (TIGR02574 family)